MPSRHVFSWCKCSGAESVCAAAPVAGPAAAIIQKRLQHVRGKHRLPILPASGPSGGFVARAGTHVARRSRCMARVTQVVRYCCIGGKPDALSLLIGVWRPWNRPRHRLPRTPAGKRPTSAAHPRLRQSRPLRERAGPGPRHTVAPGSSKSAVVGRRGASSRPKSRPGTSPSPHWWSVLARRDASDPYPARAGSEERVRLLNRTRDSADGGQAR